jgi:large subunit ribosomal protein L18
MIDKRTQRIRTKLKKVSSRNRLSVFRSNNHIYAQAIDDSKGITLASASTLEKELVKDQKGKKRISCDYR